MAGSDDFSDVLMGGATVDAYGCLVFLLLLPDVQVSVAVRVCEQRSIRRFYVVSSRKMNYVPKCVSY